MYFPPAHWCRYGRPRCHIELELVCDAVALVTLERLHIDSSRLMSAVAKVTRYNRQHFGDAVDESGYPTLSQRGTFAREVIEWFARGR